jgi:hypothetical protein
MRKASGPLDTSVGVSGRYDFAVRKGAVRLSAPPRPSHPAPNVRDDREAPLLEERGTAGLVELICPTAQVKFSGVVLLPMRPIGTTGKSGEAGRGQVPSKCFFLSVIARSESDDAIQNPTGFVLDCFVEPVIGRAVARPVGSQ